MSNFDQFIVSHSPCDETIYQFPNGKGASVKYINFHGLDWWYDILELKWAEDYYEIIESPYQEYDESEIEARLAQIAA